MRTHYKLTTVNFFCVSFFRAYKFRSIMRFLFSIVAGFGIVLAVVPTFEEKLEYQTIAKKLFNEYKRAIEDPIGNDFRMRMHDLDLIERIVNDKDPDQEVDIAYEMIEDTRKRLIAREVRRRVLRAHSAVGPGFN